MSDGQAGTGRIRTRVSPPRWSILGRLNYEVTLLYGIIQKHERMIRRTVTVVLNYFIITNESQDLNLNLYAYA